LREAGPLRPAAKTERAVSIEAAGPGKGDTEMKWAKPVVTEVCLGMEVTSYDSAELPPEF
jgi:coenzyme PQQ precursor peptide PqqA